MIISNDHKIIIGKKFSGKLGLMKVFIYEKSVLEVKKKDILMNTYTL
jgi:hypothetical protein